VARPEAGGGGGGRSGAPGKGDRQRGGWADGLLGDPALLVFDGPTSGMDPIQTRELRERLIRVAKAEGRAVLVSSHAVADLEGLASRICVLRDGAIVADAAAAQLLEQTKTTRLEDAVIRLLGGEKAA